jgi:hypothetical protein
MNQSALSFDAPIAEVRSTDPDGRAFINGRTAQSRHASYTGAMRAQATRSAHITALRLVWQQPLTINAVADLTGLPVSSVCSLKAALADELEAVDFETVTWGSGRTTKRTRWQLRIAR